MQTIGSAVFYIQGYIARIHRTKNIKLVSHDCGSRVLCYIQYSAWVIFIIAKTKCTTFQNEMYIFLIFSHLAKTIFERLLITV